MEDVRAPSPPAFQPLRLRSPADGTAVDLTRHDVLLGRHSGADVRVPLPDVSRQHCRFVYSLEGWEVIDLGSLNGVYVNGERVPRSLVCAGDHVRIGGLEFIVEIPDSDFDVFRRIAEALPRRKAS